MTYPDFYGKGPTPCSQLDPELFLGDNENPEEAKRACFSGGPNGSVCPYIRECLTYALDAKEPGIYGGTTEMERRGIRRKRVNRVSLTLGTRPDKVVR